MKKLRIDIYPKPKERPRATLKNGKIIMYTPTETKRFESAVKKAWVAEHGKEPEYGKDKALYMFCTISYNEESKTGWKHTAPDLTNVLKAIEDGLNGVAYYDDAQIASINANKVCHGNYIEIEIGNRNIFERDNENE